MVANKATNDLQLSLVFADILPPEAAKVPRFLLNSPFFKAHTNRSEGDTKGDKDADGESFRFGYLEIIRLGAGLNTYDFETLAALYQLINITTKASPPEITLLQERLQAKVGHAVSVQANKIDIENNTYAGIKKVNTTFGVTTPTAVCRYLGRKTDAESLSICRESIYRLNGNTFTLINHKNNRSERRVSLFSLSLNQSKAMIISFSPQLSALYHGLLDFNLTIYKQLTAWHIHYTRRFRRLISLENDCHSHAQLRDVIDDKPPRDSRLAEHSLEGWHHQYSPINTWP